jgi:hypothetical protein
MYVYIYKVLHNIWNIDLILRLQKNQCNEQNITLNHIKKKKKKKPFDTIEIYNNHFRSKINRFT